MRDIYVFLPCYNEERNITELINTWNEQKKNLSDLGYSLRIFAIDDCSTDRTKDKIKELENEYENVSLIVHDVNKNLCGGLNTSISRFLEVGNEDSLMVLMDGDNTHDPKYIYSLLDKTNQGFDCVIASRYCNESNVVGVPSHRRFMSDMARYYYRFMLRVPNVEDYTCGYRIYTYNCIKQLVEVFGSDPVKEKSFACMMELLYKLHLTGTAFSEVGFELRYDNKKGESKMQVIKTMRKSLFVAYKLRRHKTT